MRSVVEVVPHDPRWFEAAAHEMQRIARVLGDVLVRIHHIGSTSIPGIHAKPILDLLPLVRSLEALDAKRADMEALGYECRGEFGIAGRRYFCRANSAGKRTHNVHAFVDGSAEMTRHLAFRDYLIAHPEYALAYSELKRGLASAHPADLDAYMDGKEAFVRDMEARALRWSERRS
jgi:GrpB-like predicted nucleotidyltransferase (UPF0157 family)